MNCFIVAKALPLPRHFKCQASRKVHKNCQTLSVNSDPLHLFVESLLLDMFSLGIPLLRDGVRVLIFHKVSFEKHSSAHTLKHNRIKSMLKLTMNILMVAHKHRTLMQDM